MKHSEAGLNPKSLTRSKGSRSSESSRERNRRKKQSQAQLNEKDKTPSNKVDPRPQSRSPEKRPRSDNNQKEKNQHAPVSFFPSSLEEYNNLSSTLRRMRDRYVKDSTAYVEIIEQTWKCVENTILDNFLNYNKNASREHSWGSTSCARPSQERGKQELLSCLD